MADRLFGATLDGEANIYIQGHVQVNHGLNIWKENNIYTEQITSHYNNKASDPDDEKGITTIGRQSKLEEGHYLHHFSINPFNLKSILIDDNPSISNDDISKLKEAMQRGVTWYDSASKAGCENEMLVWVQLKSGSKNVLPNFSNLIHLKNEKMEGKYLYDFMELKKVLDLINDEIEAVEIYYNKQLIQVENLPDRTIEKNI